MVTIRRIGGQILEPHLSTSTAADLVPFLPTGGVKCVDYATGLPGRLHPPTFLPESLSPGPSSTQEGKDLIATSRVELASLASKP